MSAKEKNDVIVSQRPRTSSSNSLSSLQTPRIARFAEATSIDSPVEPPHNRLSARALPSTRHYFAQPQPADIDFGYTHEKHMSVEMEEVDDNQLPPARTPRTAAPLLSPPLKSAMKTPGAMPKSAKSAMFSPMPFSEEEELEKQEALTEKEQVKDLKVKTRVRVAKLLLRGVNFSCSLIVLAMGAMTFSIFNATRDLPSRNSLEPWNAGTNPWEQILVLVISCISLAFCLLILFSYWKGGWSNGHKRSEKVAKYYTVFAVGFFTFSIVMWGIGAAILQSAKSNGNDKDLWGWACKDNERRALFQNDVSYTLVCRLQNWSLVCCAIEIIVEVITISVYGVIFYRYWSKRKLRKSMARRDTARSDLYLAQLRSQSAPNTPGLNGPYSARDGGWRAPVDSYEGASEAEEGFAGRSDVQVIDASRPSNQPKPFILQPPPIRVQGATPKMQQTGFAPIARGETSMPAPLSPPPVHPQQEQKQEHFGAAPGEQVYDAVAIPGAYS